MFREGEKREKERERETLMGKRNIDRLPLPHMCPFWGQNSQPRHVP